MLNQELSDLNGQFADYYHQARFREAIQVARRMCELAKRYLGERHSDYAACLNQLAVAYEKDGDYSAARPLFLKLLSIDEPDSLEFAQDLHNWAGFCETTGDYITAEISYYRALDLKLEHLGENHPDVATTSNSLGYLYYVIGEYQAAESLYLQALDVWLHDPETNSQHISISYNNLAMLYEDMDRYFQAEELYRRALDIDRRIHGEDHPEYAVDLNNLANLYTRKGEYDKAKKLLDQALEIMSTNYGENHPEVALCLNNIGWLCQIQGKFLEAKTLFQRAMHIRREIFGMEHPIYGESLNNLAAIDARIGRLTTAEQDYLKALEIFEVSFGETHPKSITVLSNLAIFYALQNKYAQALKFGKRVVAAHDNLIDQVFALGSESQRMEYIRTIQLGSSLFISLVVLASSSTAKNITTCFDLILRRKALTAEVLGAQRDAILEGYYPHLEEKIKQLRTIRAQISQKQLAGAGAEGIEIHQERLASWMTQRQVLESQLASEIPEIRLKIRLRHVDCYSVARALPADSVLIEFLCTDVYNFQNTSGPSEARWKPPIYLAFILHANQPDCVQMVNLGEAESINRLIADFRRSVSGDRDLMIKDSAIKQIKINQLLAGLSEKLIKPLLPAIGECRRLLIAPDGNLSQIPFEALTLDQDQYVLDKYHVSYLNSGRDVLRFEDNTTASPGEPVIIADPDFDLEAEHSVRDQANSHPGGWSLEVLQRAGFPLIQLPGTHKEGNMISELLGILPLYGDQALEGKVKKCRSPKILHFATHGFFLSPKLQKIRHESALMGVFSVIRERFDNLSNLNNPLLRSGIALAGANTWFRKGELPEEAEDGLLNAEDVSAMDLLDTELVVLSACDTGLGEIHVGEGVFGLQRAFTLAGAKTLIMSLWKVQDWITQELMIDFYKRLLSGQSRSVALRDAQLEIKNKYPDPRIWAAFICQGNPGPIQAL